MSRGNRRIWRWFGVAALAALALGLGSGIWWGTHPLGPTPRALEALRSDGEVQVTQTADGWEFAPASRDTSIGLVFYPGGHVDARSYAPYAREVAAEGYLVAVPRMPLSLAVLSPKAAAAVRDRHSEIASWVVGGHSLGGAMAVNFASANRETIRGLVLLAAYAPSGDDLSSSDIEVVSIVGTQDDVIDRGNMVAGRAMLPPDARYVALEGGNHAQFGDYGPQPGDDPRPRMSAAEQRRRAVEETIEILRASSR